MKISGPVGDSVAYPRTKVFVGYLLCPSVVVLCFGIYFFVLLMFQMKEGYESIGGDLFGIFLFLGVSAIMGQVYFFFPALMLGGVISGMRFYKTPKHVVLISILAGIVAAIWSLVFQREMVSAAPRWNLFSPSLCFMLGAVSSFLISLLVLPSPSQSAEGE